MKLFRTNNTVTELVSKIILELKRGKAGDIEGLSNEHLIFSHPILPVILSRFFNLILCTRYVPVGFNLLAHTAYCHVMLTYCHVCINYLLVDYYVYFVCICMFLPLCGE